MPSAVRKNKVADSPEQRSSNPYLMAVFTASLAGIFSVAGGYFTAKFQAEQAIAQKQMEYRVSAYTAFLEKTDRTRDPVISQLLNIGSMAGHLATDSEIQAFEDRVGDLLKKHDTQDIYWQLNADVNVLRLHGSKRVAEMCDDILKSLLLRDSEIHWGKYSEEIVKAHANWKSAQFNGETYGIEERIYPDERLMIISISMLTKALIEQLQKESHGAST